MKTKLAVMLSMLVVIAPLIASVHADGMLGLPDAELMLAEFAYETGPGALISKTDVMGLGVQFDFTGLQTGWGTVVGDNFQVNALAGGAVKDYGWGWSGPYDFSEYCQYTMVFVNVGSNPVMVCLKMNTGWTDEPWAQGMGWLRDTWWQSCWTDWFGPGECRLVTLDFSSCGEAWNIADDPEYPGYTEGQSGVALWRLDEVSDIGFQVLADGEASIVVGKLGTWGVIPEVPFGTIMTLVAMFTAFTGFVGLKRFKPSLHR